MFTCPIPAPDPHRIRLAHGGGGEMTSRLIEDIFLPAFGTENLTQHDSAVVSAPKGKLAITTDSFVVHPIEFSGGDIGSLAIHGTVNDLSMSGARPLYITAGFILEEGLDTAVLSRIAHSMGQAARQAGITIVAGDTKVVEQGKGDGLYINTSGIGIVEHSLAIAPSSIEPGDAVLVSGDIGRHGITIMSARAGIDLQTDLQSDSANLWPSVSTLLQSGIAIHCLRDITRGGLSMTLNELAETSGTTILLDETAIPVCETVRSTCDLLGLDILQTACEGRYLAIVPEKQAEQTLLALQRHNPEAARIGTVIPSGTAPLLIDGLLGVRRILSKPYGEQLPRIC